MKRIICSFFFVLLVLAFLCSCGSDFYGTGKKDIKKYVTLGEYKNLKVDTNSEDFKEYFDSVVIADANANDFFDEITEGKVKSGDKANIDYVGKRDGIAFEGGTASGYDLTIGSGTFIPGFEDGLIGVDIGNTVDLNLRFPEDYDNSELAGAAVVFTVTVNSVKTPKSYKENYKALKFDSVEDYEKNIKERAFKEFIKDKVCSEAKFDGQFDNKTFNTVVYLNAYENAVKITYGADLYQYLSVNGISFEEYTSTISEQITSERIFSTDGLRSYYERLLVYYAILDAEDIKVKKSSFKNAEGMERAYKESVAVVEAVENFLYENSKLK